MLTSDGGLRRDAIRRTLVPEGAGAEAQPVSEATFGIWQRVAAQLTPVIGARGVDVLFRRSLHVTGAEFPWLIVAGDGGHIAALIDELKARFAAHDPATATTASYALLVTFTELLASMIGGALTDRLLDPVWVPPSPEQAKESHDE